MRWVDAGREKADGRTLLVRNIGYATRTEEVREKFQARFPENITVFALAAPLLSSQSNTNAPLSHAGLRQDPRRVLAQRSASSLNVIRPVSLISS